MKKNRILLEIVIFLIAVFHYTIIYLFRELHPLEGFSGMFYFYIPINFMTYIFPLMMFQKSINNSENVDSERLNYKFRIMWAIISLSMNGLFIYYAYNHTPDMGYNLCVVLFGIFLMIEGNYQSILPKNSGFNNGMAETYANAYGDDIYKKSQRLAGRFQFYFGLIITILFLISPNTHKIWLYGIFGVATIYYLGAWWILYKNTQIIAESEAKTK